MTTPVHTLEGIRPYIPVELYNILKDEKYKPSHINYCYSDSGLTLMHPLRNDSPLESYVNLRFMDHYNDANVVDGIVVQVKRYDRLYVWMTPALRRNNFIKIENGHTELHCMPGIADPDYLVQITEPDNRFSPESKFKWEVSDLNSIATLSLNLHRRGRNRSRPGNADKVYLVFLAHFYKASRFNSSDQLLTTCFPILATQYSPDNFRYLYDSSNLFNVEHLDKPEAVADYFKDARKLLPESIRQRVFVPLSPPVPPVPHTPIVNQTLHASTVNQTPRVNRNQVLSAYFSVVLLISVIGYIAYKILNRSLPTQERAFLPRLSV